MKQLKILLLTVIVFVFCMCLPACFLFDSQNTANTSSNSSSGNNSNSSGSSNGNNNNSKPQTDTDGTFIFSGSSIKAASTSISGDIVIPSEHNGNKIDTIPKEAFKGCTAITSVVVPNSVTTIGGGAFSGCSSIKKITLPFVGKQKGNSNDTDAYFGYIFGDSKYQGGTSVTVYGAWVGWYIPSILREVTITDETVISNGAFYKCSMLTKINLNDGIIQVGTSAFQGCSQIEEINLPNITIIPASLFEGCLSLSKFNIGNSVDTIKTHAFKDCSALMSINSEEVGEFIIPDSVTSIGDGAFSGCSLIKKITLPFIGKQKGNSNDTDAYFGYIFGDSKYQGSTSVTVYGAWVSWYIPSLLREVTITNETVIAQGAFYKCSMLNKITINSEAKNNVGKDAFTGTVTPTWAPRSPQQMI